MIIYITIIYITIIYITIIYITIIYITIIMVISHAHLNGKACPGWSDVTEKSTTVDN